MNAIAPSSANWRCRKCGLLWAVPGLHPDCDGEEFDPVSPARRFSVSPILPPHNDPAFWRRLMRGFAMVCRGAAGVFPSESARAKTNALFCRDHALRLEGRP